MSKSLRNKQHQNRIDYRVINDDVIVFRRHNRLYRISNLANNWLPGKLFVLINANTTDRVFEVADRINFLASNSRIRSAKLIAELWQTEDHRPIRDDLNIILEVLTQLGLTEVQPSTDPANAPREFGKPWIAKPAKLARL